MDTEQFNIRLPKGLLNDLNLISQILHVNKAEYIKTKLGELIYEERKRLLKDMNNLADKELISKSQIKKLKEVINC